MTSIYDYSQVPFSPSMPGGAADKNRDYSETAKNISFDVDFVVTQSTNGLNLPHQSSYAGVLRQAVCEANRPGRPLNQFTKTPATQAEVVAYLENFLSKEELATPKGRLLHQILTNVAGNIVVARFREHPSRKLTPTSMLRFVDFPHFLTPESKNKPDKTEALQAVAILKYGLRSITRTTVHTPHPTEVLNHAAIVHTRHLINLLHAMPVESMRLSNHELSYGNISEQLAQCLDDLLGSLAPPKGELTAKDEILRDVGFGKDAFETITYMIDAQSAAITKITHEFQLTGQGGKSTLTELESLGNLYRMHTWAGGDRDSKPQTTAQIIEYGIQLNHQEVKPRYIQSIQKIMLGRASGGGKRLSQSIIKQLQHVMNDIHSDSFDASRVVERLKEIKTSAEDRGYSFLPHRNRHGVSTLYSELDVLIVQMMNIRNAVARQHVRQNAEMHSKVTKQVLDRLRSANLLPKNLNDATIDGSLNYMLGNKEERKKINQFLKNEIATIGKGLESLNAKINAPKPADNIDELIATRDYYETLKGFELAATNAHAVPFCLIAEAKSEQDLLKAFFLLEAMTPSDLYDDPTRSRVEISTLVEDRESIVAGGDINTLALQNQYFNEHHVLRNQNAPALRIYDADSKDDDHCRPLTVKDVKQRHGIFVQPGDDQKITKYTKMHMYPGSDSLRGHSVAISPIMVHAQKQAIIKGLNMSPPVLVRIFMGAGSAVGRKNPVLAGIRTVQGREMRMHGPMEKAQEAESVIVTSLCKLLGNRDRGAISDRKGLHVAGYMDGANKMLSPQLEQTILKASQAGCEHYETLLHHPYFAEYMQTSSGVHFAKLYSYAARLLQRVGTNGAGSFPPQVDPIKLRAIGFGLGLTSSGSNAPLYYGLTQALGLGEHEHLAGTQLAKAAKALENSPTVRDTIARTAYGLVTADMSVAWSFAGYNLGKNDQTSVTHIKTGQEYCIEQLNRAFVSQQNSDIPHEIQILANIHTEYERCLQAVYALYSKAESNLLNVQPPSGVANMSASNKLLSVLPKELVTEVALSHGGIKWARRELATHHRQMIDGEITMPKKVNDNDDDQKLYEHLWFAFATIVELFENSPISMRAPGATAVLAEMDARAQQPPAQDLVPGLLSSSLSG